MKKVLSLLGLAVAFLLFSSVESYACFCASPDPKLSLSEQIQNSLKSSEAVFSGEVIKIEKASQILKVTIKIENVWKGDLSETTTIITVPVNSSCSFSFETERTYLIYANGNLKEDFLVVGMCSRTKLIALAKEDLMRLGERKVIKPIQ